MKPGSTSRVSYGATDMPVSPMSPRSAGVTRTSTGSPSRRTVRVSGTSGLALMRAMSSARSTSSPSTASMTSRTLSPARSAGSSGMICTICGCTAGPMPRSPISKLVCASGVTCSVRSRPSTSRTTTGISRSARGRTSMNSASQVSTARPATLTIRSPTPIPARAAGESSITRPTTGGAISYAGSSAPW